MTDRRQAIDAWESLFRAQHEVFHEISADFVGPELTQAEYDVLLTVTRGPDQTARLRDVTSRMLISQPSVSRLVDRMVERGLVSKCPDPDDGRGALVRALQPGSYELERATHAQFASDLVEGQREWFHISGLLQAHIAAIRDYHGDPREIIRRESMVAG